MHIFEAVRKLRTQGVTILYTTHYLAEAEDLCDRIAIMDEGNVVALGTVPELLGLSKTSEVIELRLRQPTQRVEGLQSVDGVQRVEQSGPLLRLYTSRAEEVLPRLWNQPALEGKIVQVRVSPVSLETIFIELTGKDLRDE